MAKIILMLIILFQLVKLFANGYGCCTMSEHREAKIRDMVSKTIYNCFAASQRQMNYSLMKTLSNPKQDNNSYSELILNQVTFHSSTEAALHQNWLEADISLHVLELKRTNIIFILDDAFNTKQFRKLVVLTIVDAPIASLQPDAFSGLSNLKTLTLKSVQISTIKLNTLQNCPNLMQFEMSKCGPQQISLDNLFGDGDQGRNSVELNQLREIVIEECNLNDTINASTFSKLTNVTKMQLNSNNIRTIGVGAFDVPFRTLTHLDLVSNQLTWLPVALFNITTHQHLRINFDYNPWHCDLKMEKLRTYKRINVHLNRIFCQTPKRFANKSLLTIVQPLKVLIPLRYLNAANFSKLERKPQTVSNLVEKPNPFENDVVDSSGKNRTKNKQKVNINTTQERFELEKTALVQCKASISPRLRVNLTRPLYGKVLVKDLDRFISSRFHSNVFMFIVFEQIRTNEKQFVVKCKSVMKKLDKSPHFNFQANRMYRLCLMDKSLKTITPLNCIEFHLYHEPTEIWISVENRKIIIVTFILFGVSGLVLGILCSLVLASFFPNLAGKESNGPVGEIRFAVPNTIEKINQTTD